MSLGTGYTTCVFNNPPSPIANSLRAWYQNNSSLVNDMILEEAFKDTNVLLPPPSMSEIVPVRAAAQLIDTLKVMWVCGTVELIPSQESLWYKACQGCNKNISANVNWEFPCTSCGVQVPGQPRCHVGVYLSADRSSLPATLFSPDTEKLILCTASDLKEADDKNVSLMREISLRIQGKKIYCFLKRLDKKFQGNSTRTYPVLKMYLESEVAGIQGTSTDSIVISTGQSSNAAELSADLPRPCLLWVLLLSKGRWHSLLLEQQHYLHLPAMNLIQLSSLNKLYTHLLTCLTKEVNCNQSRMMLPG